MGRILGIDHHWVSKRTGANFSYVATPGRLKKCWSWSAHALLETVVVPVKDWNLGTSKTK